jgi:hypothetical protein
MSLSDLGNLGEFVGAVAVVISLLYLAIQIRQNTRSLRASAHHSITAHIAELNRTIVENGDVAAILEAGLKDPAGLSPEERRRFNAYNSARFRHYDNLYYQYRVGTLEGSQWHGFDSLLRTHLRQPGIARWWEESCVFYSDEFVAYVRGLQDADADAPPPDPDDLW